MSLPEVRGVTIDASYTKDIDDAIWVVSDGAYYRVLVSISDVSEVVQPRSQLDELAKERVTTKYYARGNSPMLPRELSEGSLSLFPGAPRKTLTVEALVSPTFDKAQLLGISATQLTSEARIAYTEIPGILADSAHRFHSMLADASHVALGLLDHRRRAGALALYDLNNGWITTEEGYLRKVESKEETMGNIIVQELMILANFLVAEFVVGHDIPVPFRNHVARAAAPDRSELMAQIQSAFSTPLSNLDLIRQQTHMLLDKASYGATLFGHYGLNLPAYLHFTSPIRRYADLVTHQQVRAFIKGECLPYSRENLEQIAEHMNQVIQADRQKLSECLKEKANAKAQVTLDTRRLEGLNLKDFERVIKVWTRSPNELREEIRVAFFNRLKDNRVPLVCFASILEANPDLGWKSLQEAMLSRLASKPEDAVSVLTQATQMYSWPTPTFQTVRQGPDHAPTFTVHASLHHPKGVLTGGPAKGTTSKEARQYAALALLAEIVGLPVPAAPVAVEGAAEVPLPTNDPISVLQSLSQTRGEPPPEYHFSITGPPHLPEITCECVFTKFRGEASAGKKQDAKRLAALAVLKLMSAK